MNISGRTLARYCLIPYSEDTFDCADLVVLVQKELFGRDVNLPRQSQQRGNLGIREIHRQIHDFLVRTDNPVDGDVVLMKDVGLSYAGHVGVYFRLNGQPSVLHSNSVMGTAVITPIRELGNISVALQDYFTWHSPPTCK